MRVWLPTDELTSAQIPISAGVIRSPTKYLGHWRGFIRSPVKFRRSRILAVLAIICLVAVVVILQKMDQPDADSLTDFYQPPEESFARADISEASRYLSESWPTYQGYNDKFANAHDNPIDSQLAERIKVGVKHMKSPLFLHRNEPRHEWKFEKVIHQTWKDDYIPSATAGWVAKWLKKNPDWTHIFWTDSNQEDFISKHFPMLYDAYDSFTHPVQKADMFRYLALYAFGGVYADLDVEDLRELDRVREMGSCVLSREPAPHVFVLYPPLASWANNWTLTCNAFIACQSHHPFLHYLIARTVQNSPLVRRAPCPLEKTILCTGPWMMSFAYAFYKRSVNPLEKSWEVICPKYEYFLPTYDPSRKYLVRRHCMWMKFFGTEAQKEVCAREAANDFRNEPMGYSYTNHRWISSYHNEFSGSVNVRSVALVKSWIDKGLFTLCRDCVK